MKKIICFLTVLAVAAILLAPLSAAFAMPYFEDATVIGDEVNMRMRPTTDAPVIIKLSQGNRIGVFCEEVEGWYRIIYGNYRGYISADYVFLPSTDQMVGNVTQSGAELRQNPGAYSLPVATLDEGTGLSITDISGEWYYAETAALLEEGQAKSGYIHRDSVKLSSAKTASMLLKPGMSGAHVRNIQQKLRERGFLLAPATGYYGDATEGAVKIFQKKAGLNRDGIVGQETYDVLFSDKEFTITKAELYGIRGDVKLSNWIEIRDVFSKGSTALITDVKSGRKFWAKRTGGHNHADTEPLTKEDTEIMKKCFGGHFNDERRPVWVTVGSVTYAGSIYGEPHGVSGSKIRDNGYDGVFCIHFKGTRLHLDGTDRQDTVDARHQAAVQYAYDKAH